MKIKSLVLSTTAALVVAVAGLASPALADSPGQIGGGDIYRIKNLTQNVDYTSSAKANACDQLEYKVRLHNSGYSSVTDIVTSATLPGGASTTNVSKMTVTYSGGVESSVSASATLNLTSAQTVSYVGGSTQLLNKDSQLIKSLPDGVTSGGVNIGSLNGSSVEFVQFQAKVSCPQTPPTPPTPPAAPTAPGAPTQLVNTGPGSTAAIVAIATVAGTLGYRRFLSRRLSRQ